MGGGSREPRTAIEVSFSAWGGLEKLDRGRDRGETFFPDIGSDRDSDETFQISRNLEISVSNTKSSFVFSIHSFAYNPFQAFLQCVKGGLLAGGREGGVAQSPAGEVFGRGPNLDDRRKSLVLLLYMYFVETLNSWRTIS